jgi:phosphatidate cytidylyltransferase
MLKRTISAIIALPLLFFVLFSGGVTLYVATLAVSIVGLYEFYKAFTLDYKPVNWAGYIATIALYLGFLGEFSRDYFSFVTISFMFLLMGLLVFTKHQVQSVAITFLGFFYVTFSLSHLILISNIDDNYFIWYPFIIAFITDTFAYLTGKIMGKTPLIPSVSPNKTVEGSLGGMIACILFTYLYAVWGKPEFQFYAIFLGLIGGMLSQVGDLIASKIKRIAHIKDFGKIMPGHGGVLDRFDSILITLPLVYYFMVLFNYINDKLI